VSGVSIFDFAPVLHEKNDKNFLSFDLATNDSYRDTNGAWQQKKPVWHKVFCFSPKTMEAASHLTAGQRVKVTASISYRKIAIVTEGGTRNGQEAILVARAIEPAPLPRRGQA